MDFRENILAILPPESRAKLESLLIERNAARAAYRAASDAEMHARQEFGRAEGAARQRLAMPGGIELDMHPAAALARPTKAQERERSETEARLMAPVDAAKRRLDLAVAARDKAAERQKSFAFLENVAAWLNRAASFGGMRLKHHAPAAPKVRDPRAEIQKLRSELKALDEAWLAAENAPAPVAELKSRFLTELDAIAAKGAPKVNHAARAGSPVNLAAALRIGQMPVALADGGTHFSLVGDGGASFFTWLMRDEIAAKIGAMIDAAPAEGALTDDERDAEFSRISTRRLEIERAEEALIVAAEQEGRAIQRRRDADPRAILEVAES
ncbi:hypothetical protein ACFO1V_09945 [Daeguia caeni]|uniref:Uncharacterized protein n=1 Tax=Daeguia caeni TaxID=439612 RepID=A0ABV9H7X0_9HYPH